VIATAAFVITLALVLLGLLFWLLFPPQRRERPKSALDRLEVEDLRSLHSRYFPQIRQALSASDGAFLQRRVPRRARRVWQAERRHVAQQYLDGLRNDFRKLNRLARTVAALSPHVSRRQEIERFWLCRHFHVLYWIVGLRLQLGFIPLPQLASLTDLVGRLSLQIEAAMALLERDSSSLRETFTT
jgi:HAMP domain-containing protein/cbb3-type cytochrome oxidase subunit 3